MPRTLCTYSCIAKLNIYRQAKILSKRTQIIPTDILTNITKMDHRPSEVPVEIDDKDLARHVEDPKFDSTLEAPLLETKYTGKYDRQV